MSTFADRLRGIVRQATPDARLPPPGSTLPAPDSQNLSALGGEWRLAEGRSCFVVERRWDGPFRYGGAQIGDMAAALERAGSEAGWFARGAHPPFLFFDLETTGLSGGAGTQAFLVGCGWFEPDGAFATRQFLLTRIADERPLLEAVAGMLSAAGALVSFNGKSFDAPLIEMRYLFHRLPWAGAEMPHLDVLHSARRFWGERNGLRPTRSDAVSTNRTGDPREAKGGCSLAALEQSVVGAPRSGDVPGFEIPARYFQFVRRGDARVLAPVLEHNRRDLLTLAALAARLLHLARTGPDAARDARESLAIGEVYRRAGLDDRAHEAFRRAVALSASGPIRAESLRALAASLRRARRHDEAARCWRELLELAGCPAAAAREATEALAIHHEHRLRDLAGARAFARRCLDEAPCGPRRWTGAVHHRLTRIEEKLKRERGALMEKPGSTLNYEV